jgi:signal transduction histidine kinase
VVATVARGLAVFVRAPVAGETWREVEYTLVTTVMAVPAFLLALAGLVAGALSLMVVGLPVLVAVLAGGRLAVRYFRAPARVLLGRSWAGPVRLGGQGPVRRARALLVDGRAWRALVYCFLRLPLAATTAYVTVAALVVGVVSLTCPVWSPFVPTELDNWSESWTVATGGVIVLLVFPWPLRLSTLLDRFLVDTLLAPGPAAQRIARLESGRAALTADAATTLRRLERDLHDGTQARLVSLGMALSRIGRRLDRLPDDTDGIGELRGLVGSARDSVTDGLAELRDIVRGIHPPALDDGLATALATLAARSGLPVDARVTLAEPPGDAAAGTLYFAAAELLANAARHADAGRVVLRLSDDEGSLRLVVTDDGRGGAGRPVSAVASGAAATGGGAGRSANAAASDAGSGGGSGTGLAGLARRAEALDGWLDVVSPPGGPTTVTMTLPLTSGPGG